MVSWCGFALIELKAGPHFFYNYERISRYDLGRYENEFIKAGTHHVFGGCHFTDTYDFFAVMAY